MAQTQQKSSLLSGLVNGVLGDGLCYSRRAIRRTFFIVQSCNYCNNQQKTDRFHVGVWAQCAQQTWRRGDHDDRIMEHRVHTILHNRSALICGALRCGEVPTKTSPTTSIVCTLPWRSDLCRHVYARVCVGMCVCETAGTHTLGPISGHC